MKAIKVIKVKRCIFLESKESLTSVQLHGFSDSSETAYCAVVYLRKQTSFGVNIELIASKTKVAPLKRINIHRLELSSCVLLSELVVSVELPLKEHFKDMSIFCWNDNASSIGWIRGVHKEWSPWHSAYELEAYTWFPQSC